MMREAQCAKEWGGIMAEWQVSIAIGMRFYLRALTLDFARRDSDNL